MALSLVTGPTDEPLDLNIIKPHLKASGVLPEDNLVRTVYAPAARERGELATGRAFLTQTWDLILDAFPEGGFIAIPKPPLQSVTSITYVDMAGVTQTWASSNYLVQAPAGPRAKRGRVALPFAGIWPIARPQMGAITVRFVCGYGDSYADMPDLLRWAMLQDVGTMFVNREGVVLGLKGSPEELPLGIRAVYWAYRSHTTQRQAA